MLEALMGDSLVVVAAIFFMSLVGAYILFAILKSVAQISNKAYQAGGALAGFIILYLTMFQSYQSLHHIEVTEKELKVAKKSLEKNEINGTIIPNSQTAKIVIATQQTDADDNGKFKLLAKCISPEDDDVKVYVIFQDGRYRSLRIPSTDKMKNLEIRTQ